MKQDPLLLNSKCQSVINITFYFHLLQKLQTHPDFHYIIGGGGKIIFTYGLFLDPISECHALINPSQMFPKSDTQCLTVTVCHRSNQIGPWYALYTCNPKTKLKRWQSSLFHQENFNFLRWHFLSEKLLNNPRIVIHFTNDQNRSKDMSLGFLCVNFIKKSYSVLNALSKLFICNAEGGINLKLNHLKL